MAGPNLSQLSSNWKALQETLQTEKKKQHAPKSDLKRKRPLEQSSKPNHSFKRARHVISSANTVAIESKRRMGGYISKSTATPTTSSSRSRSTLTDDHDIPAEALAAAYGTPNTSRSTVYKDEINAGTHPSHKIGKFVALDCEMVGTGPPPHSDNLLARASLVNYHGEQIYDSYVLPPPNIPVTDFRTHVSGIRPSHLVPGVARTFAAVQADVAKMLEGRVLVGHALRNDMQVLLLGHPKRDVRDTSRYPGYRVGGRPAKLRDLSRRELGLEIQSGEHSSVEDARAAMALYRKQKKGFEEENRKRFGTNVRGAKDGKKGGRQAMVNVGGEDDEEDDDDDDDELDEDLLDGEDVDQEVGKLSAHGTAAHPKAKKRKKKKRTKRS